MPIIVPPALPTRWMLESEGVFVIDEASAERQDARPLRVLLADPAGGDELAARVASALARSPLQVELALLRVDGAGGALTPDVARDARFDAFILGHAPYDRLDWSAVPGADDLRDLLDWAGEAARAHLYLGWGARFALHHAYGVDSTPLIDPASGPRAHRVVRRSSWLLRGVDDRFVVDEERDRATARDELDLLGLEVLAEADDGAPLLVRNYDRRKAFLTAAPPGDGDSWRAQHALILANWLDYYVYQPASLDAAAAPADVARLPV